MTREARRSFAIGGFEIGNVSRTDQIDQHDFFRDRLTSTSDAGTIVPEHYQSIAVKMSYRNLANYLLATLLGAILMSGVAMADPNPLASGRPLGPTRVALTIDDLPAGSAFPSAAKRREAMREILAVLKANGVTGVYGFSNGHFIENDPEEKSILRMWLAAKNRLGNHTYHHLDLNKVGTAAFIDDIAKEDALLATLDTAPEAFERRRVFRYPYLSEGDTLQKREAVRKYLSDNRYRIAEVTTDYFDWAWDAAFDRCTAQHGEKSIEWLKSHIADSADRQLREANLVSEHLFHSRICQIVLVHFNTITSQTLGAILKHWKEEGVQFVTLDKALAERIYRLDPKYAYPGGRSFLGQIAESLGIDLSVYGKPRYSTASLSEVCKPLAGK